MDELLHVNENGAKGTYTFNSDLDFYKGHFKNNPITPGVILIEVMAQIGVVCLAIYLLGTDFNHETRIAFTSSQMDFLKPVYPNEKVTVISEKVYFRFNKLKCKVTLFNASNQQVCFGTMAGMIV